MSEAPPLRILWIGLEPKSAQVVEEACEGADFTRIYSVEEFAANFEHWEDDTFNVIFCGPGIEGMAGIEIAQVLLNQCPSVLKYFITINTDNYEPRMLIKNGLTATFVLPIDTPLLKKAIHENVVPTVNRERTFRTVKLLDLSAGEPLGFETFLYMPLNKRYIRYTSAGAPIEPEKIEKLEKRQMSNLWLDHRDMNKFYQYSAKKLRELGDPDGVSSTEKQEKLKDCVRGLFSDIFDQSVKADFDQGRETIKHCESIISNYITKGISSNWYKKLMASIGEGGDTYNHSSNVSTFAALFAIGMGHKHPEDLAMAGLFHDLGLAQLPDGLQDKNPLEMSDEEKVIYYTHPEKSVVMIKNKRIIIPDSVEKAILLHHEMANGLGWPKKLPVGRISDEAQILSFADQFDYLTRFQEGKPHAKPLEALESIRKTGSISGEILSQIRRILEKESNLVKSA
jgi:HD-GYP domain-containing protein (c-di-GMP phosphodiesterase class II)